MSPSNCLRKSASWSLAACLLILAGCGTSAESSVKGKVTLDGSPLDEATISFIPVEGGQDKAAWAMVDKGGYELPVASGLGIGSYRVEVRAPRTTGDPNKTDATLSVESKDLVPPKYNSKSELVAEIKPGENVADFELKSK